MVHIDELSRLGYVKYDIKPANRLFLRSLECNFGCREALTVSGILCPAAIAGKIFQLFRFFDEYVHNRACCRIIQNSKLTNQQIPGIKIMFPSAVHYNCRTTGNLARGHLLVTGFTTPPSTARR